MAIDKRGLLLHRFEVRVAINKGSGLVLHILRDAVAVDLGRRGSLRLDVLHLPLGREHLPRDGDDVREASQGQRVHAQEAQAVVLGLLLLRGGRAHGEARARLVVLLEDALELGHGADEVGLQGARVGRRGEVHAHAEVEQARPDAVDLRALGEDGVEVVDGLDGLDLDHDGGLAVQVLVDGFGGVAGEGGDAGDEAEGGRGAGPPVFGTVFGGGDDVPRFGDRVDLRDDDRGAGVESVADGRVVVTGNTGIHRQRQVAERRGRRSYRTQGMVRPSLINCIS